MLSKSSKESGDLALLEGYIEDYYCSLYNLALTYIHDEASFYTADDLVQDTFYKAYWAIQKTPIQDVLAWLSTILKNTFLTYNARQQNLQAKLEKLEKSGVHEWLIGTSRSTYDEPETAMESMEDSAALDQIFKRLRPLDRYVVLVELLGMDYRVAGRWADTLHRSLSSNNDAQRARRKRAKANLSQLVKEKNIPHQDLRRWLAAYHADQSLKDLIHTNWLSRDTEV